MSGAGPRRLPQGGRHIDRRRPLRFEFDGKQLSGFEGDTLASALLGAGRRVVARSYKYHRPRGLLGSGAEEPNAYIQIGEGAATAPNQRATETLLEQGMRLRSQNRWPSLSFDLGAVSGWMSRLLPAGFYYKTFIWPRAAWKRLYEPLIRHAAGMGRAPEGQDPDRYEQTYAYADALVVGGGISGLAAARALADAGARVILAEQSPWVGGRLLGDRTRLAGSDGAAWAESEAAELERRGNVQLLRSTTAAAVYDHNYVLLCERPQTGPRRRLWRVRANRVVLAAGAIERPIAFSGNDLPGVMLASAVRDYLRRWAVAPGSRAAVHTTNDSAYETALALADAGVEVACIVDARPDPGGENVQEARRRGIPVLCGATVSAVSRFGQLRGVITTPLRRSGRAGGPGEQIECDLLAVSGGWTPTAHLYCHSGGALTWNEARGMHLPDPSQAPLGPDGRPNMLVAGAAAGRMSTLDAWSSGAEAGGRAAAHLGLAAPVAAPPLVEEAREEAGSALWVAPGEGDSYGGRHFVDYQHDVTLADLELAVREGYDGVELAKRYTTLGMAPDQGKVSNVPGHAILADALGGTLAAAGTTTIRPPYTPVDLGAIAGAESGELFRAVRETPPYRWHQEHGADFEPVGDWRRPYCYRRGGESREEAVAREVRGVRGAVGIIDASTLGKMLVQGPDAARFLDLVYTNMMSSLPVGRCRYGLMCTDVGFLFDDGVVARLSEDAFICHTTSGGAERVHRWLEDWLQCEWHDLRVYVVNVTEQWGQFAVSGPRSRELLQSLGDGLDLAEDALPQMGLAEGTVRGVPARAYRISFSGELAYEIAVPAGYAASLWNVIQEAGQAYGMVTYGTEALHVMRAEKGFIMIGDETDGTVTPIDLGLSWAVSKKKADFLGKRGMAMPALADPNRRQLVGLLTADFEEVLPDGACIVEGQGETVRIVGHVTSSYRSPTLGRSIAMALLERGRDRMGESVSLQADKERRVEARVTGVAFLDRDRETNHA